MIHDEQWDPWLDVIIELQQQMNKEDKAVRRHLRITKMQIRILKCSNSREMPS